MLMEYCRFLPHVDPVPNWYEYFWTKPPSGPKRTPVIILHQSGVHTHIHTNRSHQITSFEEVDGFPPALVLRHRQSSCDLAPEAVKAMVDELGVARVNHVIVKPPIQGALRR